MADPWQTVRAITNLWNASGVSDEWTSSAVTMRGSINAAVVSAGALTVSTCTATSFCCGIQHFLVRYAGSDSLVFAPIEHGVLCVSFNKNS